MMGYYSIFLTHMNNFFTKKVCSSILSGVLITSFLFAPVSGALRVQHVEAVTCPQCSTWMAQIPDYVIQGAQLVQAAMSAASASLTASGVTSLNLKENWLDGLAWMVVDMVLSQMIKSVTQWINNGFQGSPAFLTDMTGFLGQIADKVAGDLISGAGLAGLCSPFSLNVKMAIDLQYQKSQQSSYVQNECTLSGVVNNMENFLGGDFLEGGWEGWFEMTSKPQNNPYGAALEASGALSIGISNSQGKELNILSMGAGFLSKKECKSVPNRRGTGGTEMVETCSINTPGKFIESQLNSSIAGSQRRIEIADEINEMVAALFSQLVSAALSGAGGLLGLTGGSGGSNYIDSSYSTASAGTAGSSGGTNFFTDNALSPSQYSVGTEALSGESPFKTAKKDETDYRDIQQTIISHIEAAQAYVLGYKSTLPSDYTCTAPTALTTSLTNSLATARDELAKSEALLTKITTLETELATLNNPQSLASETDPILTKYGVTTTAEAMQKVLAEFAQVIPHTSSDVIKAKMETLVDVDKELDGYNHVTGSYVPGYKANYTNSCYDTDPWN